MGRYRAHLFGTREEDEEAEEQEALALINEEDSYETPRRVNGHVIDSPSYYNPNHVNDYYRDGGMDGMHPFLPPDYFGPPPTTPKKPSWVIRFVTVAILAYLVARYCPEAPPLNSSGASRSWTEFMLIEGGRMTSSLLEMGRALQFSLYFCIVGIVDDVKGIPNSMRQLYDDWQESRRTVCPLRLPLSGTSEEWLSTRILGQRRAVSVVATALDAWDIDGSNEQRRHPLVLVFTGAIGVGKLEMSRQISHLLFQHCSQAGNTMAGDIGYNDEGFLLLRGEDFSSEAATNNISIQEQNDNSSIASAEEELIWRIGSHIQRQKGAGAVVVIHHVEKMPSAILKRLCKQISAPEATLSYSKKAPQEGYRSLPVDQSKVLLESVIFIFTTSIGAKTMTYNMKKFGAIDHVTQLDLKISLQHELKVHFGDDSVGQVFHAIAPFAFLGSSTLERILEQKIEHISLQRSGRQWKRLLTTEAARKAIVNKEHVEFLDLKRTESEVSSIVFSTTGAKAFETGSLIMNRVKSQVKRCLTADRPDRFALLDFDVSARQALFCWCDSGNTSCDDPSCHETCRFSL